MKIESGEAKKVLTASVIIEGQPQILTLEPARREHATEKPLQYDGCSHQILRQRGGL